MTAPGNDRPRFRPGQTVMFRHPDPLTGADLVGHGLVLPGGSEESIPVLPLSLLHLDVAVDNLEAVKAEDVLPHLLTPNTTETGTAG